MSCLGCDMIGSFPTRSQPSGGVFKTSCHMVCSFYFNQKYSVGFMWFNHMPTRMENHFCSITDHLQLMCWYSMQLLEMFKFAHSEVCTKAWTLLQHFWWCNAILMYQHRVRGWSFFVFCFTISWPTSCLGSSTLCVPWASTVRPMGLQLNVSLLISLWCRSTLFPLWYRTHWDG